MSLVVLLILSEDDVWCNQINQIQLSQDFEFYYEKQAGLVNLDNITLGSLLILVIVRTIQYNLSRVKDKYLHTNCLATLANMSSRLVLRLHKWLVMEFVLECAIFIDMRLNGY